MSDPKTKPDPDEAPDADRDVPEAEPIAIEEPAEAGDPDSQPV